MSKTTSKKYKISHIEMLTTAGVIIDNAIADKKFLQSKRTSWADPFFEKLKEQIQTTSDTYLGKDSEKNMRLASQVVYKLLEATKPKLSEIKIQIEQDFKNQPDKKKEILTQLGFADFYKKAKKNNQEPFVNLLFQFKQNLTPELKKELISNGIASESIETLVENAQALKEANINQETFKTTRLKITDQATTAFNNIYDQIIAIATISKIFYSNDPVKQKQFSFNKIGANLSSDTNKKPKKV